MVLAYAFGPHQINCWRVHNNILKSIIFDVFVVYVDNKNIGEHQPYSLILFQKVNEIVHWVVITQKGYSVNALEKK